MSELVHLRQKALPRGPRQTRDTHGAFAGDPQASTLCGAAPTTSDMGWSEIRVATSKNFEFVTCSGCREARFPQPAPAQVFGTLYDGRRMVREPEHDEEFRQAWRFLDLCGEDCDRPSHLLGRPTGVRHIEWWEAGHGVITDTPDQNDEEAR